MLKIYLLLFLEAAHSCTQSSTPLCLSWLSSFLEGDLKPAFRLSRDSFDRLPPSAPRPHGSIHGLSSGRGSKASSVPNSSWPVVRCAGWRSMAWWRPSSIGSSISPSQRRWRRWGQALLGLQICCRGIDGCHVRVLPPAEQKKSYFNRKLFTSIILQGICDAKSKCIDIYIGNPGSVHDALVLRRSPFYN